VELALFNDHGVDYPSAPNGPALSIGLVVRLSAVRVKYQIGEKKRRLIKDESSK
jgi:hypothetical protein